MNTIKGSKVMKPIFIGRGPLTTLVLHSATADDPKEGATSGGVIGPIDKLVLRCGSGVRIPTQNR
jgi:hypothetical protein